jgi:hypothetical protein
MLHLGLLYSFFPLLHLPPHYLKWFWWFSILFHLFVTFSPAQRRCSENAGCLFDNNTDTILMHLYININFKALRCYHSPKLSLVLVPIETDLEVGSSRLWEQRQEPTADSRGASKQNCNSYHLLHCLPSLGRLILKLVHPFPQILFFLFHSSSWRAQLLCT